MTMIKYIIPMLLLVSQATNAQSISRSVIGSAGKTQTAGSITLRSTTGEAATKTLSKPGLTLQQGFQHGTLLLARIENNEVPAAASDASLPDISLHIYPNPTADFVHVSQENESSVLNYLVVDASGKTISEINGTGNEDTIDFTSFSPGTYFLIALDKENQRKSSYKIVKTR